VGIESCDSKTLGDWDNNIKLECVLNESGVFAFNALTELSLNWSEPVKYMQVKFHSGVEFTTHFFGEFLMFSL
jgi:hypothetical protein